MSSDESHSNQQAEAWKELVRILPIILPEKKNRGSIKANFEEIKSLCVQEGQQFGNLFRRLKNAASTLIREDKRQKFAKNIKIRQAYGFGFREIESSSESEEENDDEFIPEVKITNLEAEIENDKPNSWEFHSFANNPAAQNEFRGFLDRFVNYLENDEEEDSEEFTLPNNFSNDQDFTAQSSNFDELQDDSLQADILRSGNISPEFNEENEQTLSTSVKAKTCDRCGCGVSKHSTKYCKQCRTEVNREEKLASTPLAQLNGRTCNSCNGPISAKSKGLCKTCHMSAGKSNRLSTTSSVNTPNENEQSIQSSKPQKRVSEARAYRLGVRYNITCSRCNKERVHFAQKMCQTCYKVYRKENNIVLVKREQPEETISGNFLQEEANNSPSTQEIQNTPSSSARRRSIKRQIMNDYYDDEDSVLSKRRKTNKCVDCQESIYPESDRCKPCFWKSKKNSSDSPIERSDKKSRSCLGCQKTISVYGKTGYCHQCFFDNRKESEFEGSDGHEAKENLKPMGPKRGVKLENESGESENNDESVEIVEPNELEPSANKNQSICVICSGTVTRRSTTGTCSTACYKRLYVRQKRSGEKLTNKSKENMEIVLDDSDNESNNEEVITEDSVGNFFEPSRACQKCWSFDRLNSRCLCKSCHEQELDDANECAKPSNKSTLDVYLEKTAQFLLDD